MFFERVIALPGRSAAILAGTRPRRLQLRYVTPDAVRVHLDRCTSAGCVSPVGSALLRDLEFLFRAAEVT